MKYVHIQFVFMVFAVLYIYSSGGHEFDIQKTRILISVTHDDHIFQRFDFLSKSI